MSATASYEHPAIAGTGTIACGLAACASALGEVRVLARSDASAWRAEEHAQAQAEKLAGGDPSRIRVTIDPADLDGCDLLVEAIVEDRDAKAALLGRLGEQMPDADLASTTSSLSVTELGAACGQAERLFGLHVFNPVPKMELVELCVPEAVDDGVGQRASAWCAALDKTVVEVPDVPGFVVNRLLFPYLFDAVRLLERTGLDPESVDECMSLGAGHPAGPLKLLDFVGLDVAVAIGESLHLESGDPAHLAPASLVERVERGELGCKTGRGFYEH